MRLKLPMHREKAKGEAKYLQEEEEEEGEEFSMEDIEVIQMEGDISKINIVTTVTSLSTMRGSVEKRFPKKE